MFFKLHRNSQKRFYGKDYTYFVTVVTQNRIPYFEEKIFCEIFYENLRICIEMKAFVLHGWFLGYDHFHMLVTPGEKANISEIMRSLKTNVSCDINRIMTFESEVTAPRFQVGYLPPPRLQEIYRHRPDFFQLYSKFHQKYPHEHMIPYPKFKWLKSFHDHVIRDERDFETHMRYIEYNPIKHKMPEGWKWWGVT